MSDPVAEEGTTEISRICYVSAFLLADAEVRGYVNHSGAALEAIVNVRNAKAVS